MDDTSKLFCPLLKDDCIGKWCAMAVFSHSYNFGTQTRAWSCGSISSKEDHVQVICRESLEDN